MIYVSDKDIKSYMAKRKRELAAVKRSFPKFQPGMSTAEYVGKYYALNHARDFSPTALFEPLNQAPAAFLTGPEVTQEVEA